MLLCYNEHMPKSYMLEMLIFNAVYWGDYKSKFNTVKPNQSMGFDNKRKPEEKNSPQAGNRTTQDF